LVEIGIELRVIQMRAHGPGTYSDLVPVLDESGDVLTDKEYLHLLDFIVTTEAITEDEVTSACYEELLRIRNELA
jgi:hypothetical protein